MMHNPINIRYVKYVYIFVISIVALSTKFRKKKRRGSVVTTAVSGLNPFRCVSWHFLRLILVFPAKLWRLLGKVQGAAINIVHVTVAVTLINLAFTSRNVFHMIFENKWRWFFLNTNKRLVFVMFADLCSFTSWNLRIFMKFMLHRLNDVYRWFLRVWGMCP